MSRVAESEDTYSAVRESISIAGDGTTLVPTPPRTSLQELAQRCLLNEFRRLDADAAARKLRNSLLKRAAMKRYWALRKAGAR